MAGVSRLPGRDPTGRGHGSQDASRRDGPRAPGRFPHGEAPASKSARWRDSTGVKQTRYVAAVSRSTPGWTCMDSHAGRAAVQVAAFLTQSARRGLRCVLVVITGQGRRDPTRRGPGRAARGTRRVAEQARNPPDCPGVRAHAAQAWRRGGVLRAAAAGSRRLNM